MYFDKVKNIPELLSFLTFFKILIKKVEIIRNLKKSFEKRWRDVDKRLFY